MRALNATDTGLFKYLGPDPVVQLDRLRTTGLAEMGRDTGADIDFRRLAQFRIDIMLVGIVCPLVLL
jgi:hypothetical protein